MDWLVKGQVGGLAFFTVVASDTNLSTPQPLPWECFSTAKVRLFS